MSVEMERCLICEQYIYTKKCRDQIIWKDLEAGGGGGTSGLMETMEVV